MEENREVSVIDECNGCKVGYKRDRKQERHEKAKEKKVAGQQICVCLCVYVTDGR